MSIEMQLAAVVLAASAGGGWMGKLAFAGVFAVLIVVIALLPRAFVGETGAERPVWKRVRLWAILVGAVQIAVYLAWG